MKKISSFIQILLVIKVHSALADCSDVIALALAANMDARQPSIYSSLQLDCCVDYTIICNTQRVTGISWQSMNLDGYIDENYIPSALTNFLINNNQLSGSFPNLPNSLTYIDLSNNRISGNLPPFSNAMKSVSIENNRLSGSVILNRPDYMTIQNNYIADVQVSDPVNLGTSSVCDISNNPLLFNPSILNLPGCRKNNLYDPDLLPNTQTTTKAKTTTISKSTTRTTSIPKSTMVTSAIPTVTTIQTTAKTTFGTSAIPTLATFQTTAKTTTTSSMIPITSSSSKIQRSGVFTISVATTVQSPISYSSSIKVANTIPKFSTTTRIPLLGTTSVSTHIILTSDSTHINSDTLNPESEMVQHTTDIVLTTIENRKTSSLVIFKGQVLNYTLDINARLKIIFRLMTNSLLLGSIFMKTPFLREFKRKLTKVEENKTFDQ